MFLLLHLLCLLLFSFISCNGFMSTKTFPRSIERYRISKLFKVLSAEQARTPEREVDVVVIGSGIGGLCAAGLSARYGYSTEVFEAHYHAGGVAHSFEEQGFKFDAGPSLWAGMSKSSTNPLRQVLDALGQDVEWIPYDGWGMHTPEGYWYFRVGTSFPETLLKYGGEIAVKEWSELTDKMRPLLRAAAAIPPLCLRADIGAGLLLFPGLVKALMAAGLGVNKLQGPMTDVMYPTVTKNSFLDRWLDYLSFALSGVPADATQAAAVIYTIGDLMTPGTVLDYPRGGSGEVIDTLIKGTEKYGGKVNLSATVKKILVEDNRAVGIELKSGEVIRARKAVITNASVWDTAKLVRGEAGDRLKEEAGATPDTASFMHLHLGIDATGLEGLNIHYSIVNSWDVPIDAPLNMIIVSIPTVLDPSLAPPSSHVVHAYYAGNEPYSLWEGLKRGSPEYKKLKEERSQGLWEALERIIPDIRKRLKVTMVASPLTHELFCRRHRGSYGPGWKAGLATFPNSGTSLPGLYRCGDSVMPGIGIPPVAASGMAAANSIVPLWKHMKFIKEMTDKGFIVSRFDEY